MLNLNPTANPQYKWNDYCVRDGRVLVAVVYGLPVHRQEEVDIYNYCDSVAFNTAQDQLKKLAQCIHHSGRKDYTFIVATHNTALISNDILRPDCYFVWNEKKQCAVSFDNLTNKELRFAHNIEKMFRAGDFTEDTPPAPESKKCEYLFGDGCPLDETGYGGNCED